MATKALKTVPKISIKIWRPIIDKFDAKIEKACLRRDAYLNKVLEVELNFLDEEVSIPNSQASYDYVFDRLDRLDRKLVSLALPSELTTRLNEICSRKRIVRDAFFNRIFLLLAASPKVIDRLLFGDVDSDWRAVVWSENKHDGPFFQSGFYPLEPMVDPFWAIRSGMEIYAADMENYIEPTSGKSILVTRDITGIAMPANSLYTTIFEQKVRENDLLGLSCYMPDWRIPGHGAEQEHQAKLDELLGELETLP
jgi:hypothetical protein